MTLVMSYVILLTALIGACAAVVEGVFERKQSPRRWIWVATLGVCLVATVLPMIWPATAVPEQATGRVFESSTLLLSGKLGGSAIAATPQVTTVDVIGVADTILPFAWLFTSAALFFVILVGQWRLRRERLLARPVKLAGHLALVSETVGPAVAGLRSPVVFVPKWVMALDEPSQHLLMAHEVEHVRKRDTTVLFVGALSVALVPWNPVAWWVVRRLRLAVEQDCDARVLAANPGVRRYADLLLLAASRHGLATRLLAAHLGEHSSDLMRRIDTMTRQRGSAWRRVLPSTVIAGVLLAAACETPRPDPVAPIDVQKEVPVAQTAPSEIERKKSFGETFSVLVFSSEGKQLARYAGEIPVSHLPKDGVQNFKADEYKCGDADCYSVRITLKPGHSLNYEEIEKGKLPYKRTDGLQELAIPEVRIARDSSETVITSAKIKSGGPLQGTVELSGDARTERIAITNDTLSSMTSGNHAEARKVPQDRDNVVLYHLYDPKGTNLVEPPNVVVYSSSGSEIARFPSSGRAMGDIALHGIESIKDEKTGNCSPLPCPLTKITLKPGFRLMNYETWKGRK